MSVPLVLRHNTSAFPSPLKSPMPATLQELLGVTALPPSVTCCDAVTCDPFIVQSTSEPLVFRHKTSSLASPLKSPIPATFQLLSGVVGLPPKVTTCDELISDPFMVELTTVPF